MTAHVLHLLPDGTAEGVRRTAHLIDQLRSGYRHSVVPADPQRCGWLNRKQQDGTQFVSDFPQLRGLPSPGRLQKIARAMLPYDVVVTHGYATMNAVMARTMFSEGYAPPPLIHHEWREEDAPGPLTRRARDLYRQLALGRAAALVVPDEELEDRALTRWQQPIGRVKRIGGAVDVRSFARTPKPDSLPGIIKRPGEIWIGVVDASGQGAGLGAALDALGGLPANCILLWASGDDPKGAVREAAARAGLDDRVHPLSPMPQLQQFLGLFDIALEPAAALWPQDAVLGALAAGIPFAGTGADRLADLAAPDNAEFLGQSPEEALAIFVAQPDLRSKIGQANRRRAMAEHDVNKLGAVYRRLFDSAVAQTPRMR